MPDEVFADYLHDAVTSMDQLRSAYGEPVPAVREKVADRVDDLTARYVAASSLVLLGSCSPEGGVDVTPRGGEPGFVRVVSERLLALPEEMGNRRLDTLGNVLRTGRMGALFLIPGRPDAVRINGRALVTMRPELLARAGAEGKLPKAALLIEPEEVFVHCPRALRFSHAWEPEAWLEPDVAPTLAELFASHRELPTPGELTVSE